MNNSKFENVIVTLTEAGNSKIDSVKKDLEEAGLVIESIQDFKKFSLLYGKTKSIESISSIDGVKAVERHGTKSTGLRGT